MIVYRIARKRYITDLSGTGARIYGGRWNRKGTGVLYTSATRALATVELLVHLTIPVAPGDLAVISVSIPDTVEPETVDLSELPANWKRFPAPQELADIGTAWAMTQESLVLKVPSAVIDYEFNFLINPLHPDMKVVSIAHVEDYSLDNRLVGITELEDFSR